MKKEQSNRSTGNAMKGKFINPFPQYYEPPLSTMLKLIKDVMLFNLKTELAPLPLARSDTELLRRNRSEKTVTWVGHSTLLVQLDGKNILTDPIWSMRAGPIRLAGSRRYTPPGLDFDDLPGIDLVLITHDHYDHLDRPTIFDLVRKHDPRFCVPLGLKRWFTKRGIARVQELDWWESADILGLELHCLPAQHFSSRGIIDRYRRLWCSWALRGRTSNLFFSGDSGYFGDLKTIGEKLGPFDLAFLPIGASKPRIVMKPVHMNAADALQAARDLRAARMVPIHWGTFILALDFGDEPVRELKKAMARDTGGGPPEVWVLAHGETRTF
jgi:N-acyl-phosphatidylethanolamine-hydrolysing phospholipase D